MGLFLPDMLYSSLILWEKEKRHKKYRLWRGVLTKIVRLSSYICMKIAIKLALKIPMSDKWLINSIQNHLDIDLLDFYSQNWLKVHQDYQHYQVILYQKQKIKQNKKIMLALLNASFMSLLLMISKFTENNFNSIVRTTNNCKSNINK